VNLLFSNIRNHAETWRQKRDGQTDRRQHLRLREVRGTHLRLREVRGTRLRTTLTAPIDSSPNLLLFIVNVVREVFSDSDIERASIW